MKILACYSNKGGVGKSATAANLAHAFAASGRRVLLCDLDPQGASSFYFRVKPSKKLTDGAFFEDVDKLTGAIRGSDFDNLDILPANASFRDFDVFLSRMRHSRSRLKDALKAVRGDYDLVVLDCPPNISTLSENVFKAADAVLVPIVPNPLSQRTFGQLLAFFEDEGLPRRKILGFFSMVQQVKSLHIETMEVMRADHPDRLMRIRIPFAAEIERMGLHRAPVAISEPRSGSAQAYAALARELAARLAED